MGSKEDLISSCRALQAVMGESVEMLERKTVDSSEVVGMETCRVMIDTARERLLEARRQLKVEAKEASEELSFGTPEKEELLEEPTSKAVKKKLK